MLWIREYIVFIWAIPVVLTIIIPLLVLTSWTTLKILRLLHPPASTRMAKKQAAIDEEKAIERAKKQTL